MALVSSYQPDIEPFRHDSAEFPFEQVLDISIDDEGRRMYEKNLGDDPVL